MTGSQKRRSQAVYIRMQRVVEYQCRGQKEKEIRRKECVQERVREMNIRLSFYVLIVAVFAFMEVGDAGVLKENFYEYTCPEALEIVKNVTWQHVAADPTVAALLLRLQFHDCFVRGCDASVLLDSTPGNIAEKDSTPDLTLGGFDVIADIKAAVEKVCPGVVSCADIIVLTARDSVSYQYRRPLWKVQLGRRDGTISRASEALANIPSPLFNFSQLNHSFATKGLDVRDLVFLSGAHTIGVSHCDAFDQRLYNYTGNGGQDPTLNPTYAAFLKTRCNSSSNNQTTVPMDPGSSLSFDNHYYKILLKREGLFVSDAALLTDKTSLREVFKMLHKSNFFVDFGKAIRKMGRVQVLTGTEGQIRTNCSAVNP